MVLAGQTAYIPTDYLSFISNNLYDAYQRISESGSLGIDQRVLDFDHLFLAVGRHIDSDRELPDLARL